MKNMKNRGIYLFVFVCLCLFCLLGALYFMGSDSQNQVPIKIYKATTFLNDKTVNEPDLDREPPQNVAATDLENADILQPTLRKPDKDEIEKARFLQIEQSPEYQDFVDSKMQELVKEYNQTGVLNFSFQEFFDFFTSQGMPHVDFAQGAHEAFREYFPTGEPEDYDVEMATRFLEVFLRPTEPPLKQAYTQQIPSMQSLIFQHGFWDALKENSHRSCSGLMNKRQ